MIYTTLRSPIGTLKIVADAQHLKALFWSEQDVQAIHGAMPVSGENALLDKAKHQLQAYFEGTRTAFDLPLAPEGTAFQQAAWQALQAIPYGETRSYGEQARAIGKPKAVRAIGGANGRNPIPLIIPCHRVIGSDGSLTGFGGGLEIKTYLLDLERSHMTRQ